MRATLAAALLLLATAAAGAAPIRIVDGDTIAVGRERIRIVGYDAPETHRAACPEEARRGRAAAAALARLLRSGRARILRTGRLDRYGRTLARVTVQGRDVADSMIADGHGRAYDGRGRRPGWCGTGRERSQLILRPSLA